ncbi:CHC2 zinc finger domain-containing protein [Saccharopolyspora sp. K220]|uniref:CHC2 zinc finger domain-containing protein n=1 Tax=Saccharopolyspora soli TaxID=2926618 RepID=UPI001F591BB4|nr:CHC2 zinc finger domain-containing protein [Saccharopolyspora soli]MCI2422700.1 CHC2 zinc finger domain-containing protein [Saccharopolyspora soli]
MSVAIAAGQQPDPDDIVEAVSQHVVLRQHGAGQLRGACPFCGSSMFRVRPSHGTFHCFGCGEGGDAAAFTARFDRP